MTMMRNRHAACDRCNGKAVITANLETGTVELKQSHMPPNCLTPTRCAQEMSKGIFDRPFGETTKKAIKL